MVPVLVSSINDTTKTATINLTITVTACVVTTLTFTTCPATTLFQVGIDAQPMLIQFMTD